MVTLQSAGELRKVDLDEPFQVQPFFSWLARVTRLRSARRSSTASTDSGSGR
jgi:hypothetical protein